MNGLLHDMPDKAKVCCLELSTCLFSIAETYLQHYVNINKLYSKGMMVQGSLSLIIHGSPFIMRWAR